MTKTTAVFKFSDYAEEMSDIYFDGIPPGTSTGWVELDRYYTVKKGQMTVVTGIPSHGKSEFLDAVAINLATKHDWRIAYYSPENHPIPLHLTKLLRNGSRQAVWQTIHGNDDGG